MDQLKQVQELIKALPEGLKGKVSDGYHTFDELYEFRMLYNAMFANLLAEGLAHGLTDPKIEVYKSKRYYNGVFCGNGLWFVVVIKIIGGKEVIDHYPIKNWDLFKIPDREMADGYEDPSYTNSETLLRMKGLSSFSLIRK